MAAAKKPRRCKDCAGQPGPVRHRPAPHPGPRCATHHRRRKAALREQAHARHIAAAYGGLTADEYQTILDYQAGVCDICLRATGRTRRLAVDHDHQTGQVRGLLCKPCNRMLGHLRDDAEAARRIADYLTNPPALAAGVDRKAPTDG